jgi:hypothetical protein
MNDVCAHVHYAFKKAQILAQRMLTHRQSLGPDRDGRPNERLRPLFKLRS